MTVTAARPTRSVVDLAAERAAEMAAALDAHGELGCADVEVMFAESASENASLRRQLAEETDRRESAEHRAAMLTSLLEELSSKAALSATKRDDMAAQVKMLHEEMAVLEAEAIPEDTLVFAAVARDQMVAEYRRVSRVTRGPLPPSVIAAVETGTDSIVEAMLAAGSEALTVLMRREVRRRRRNQRPSQRVR